MTVASSRSFNQNLCPPRVPICKLHVSTNLMDSISPPPLPAPPSVCPQKHPKYRIAILYVHANEEQVLERARRRAEETGRVVPESEIKDSLYRVPRTVARLMPKADFVAHIKVRTHARTRPHSQAVHVRAHACAFCVQVWCAHSVTKNEKLSGFSVSLGPCGGGER